MIFRRMVHRAANAALGVVHAGMLLRITDSAPGVFQFVGAVFRTMSGVSAGGTHSGIFVVGGHMVLRAAHLTAYSVVGSAADRTSVVGVIVGGFTAQGAMHNMLHRAADRAFWMLAAFMRRVTADTAGVRVLKLVVLCAFANVAATV